MIRNVVFDLGNVLVDFDPDAYLRSFGFDEETVQTIRRLIYADNWRLYDRGDYPSVLDLCRVLCERYPEYSAIFQKILQPSWVQIHTLKENTAHYLRELKARGYRIYILSNLSRESYDFIHRYSFFDYVDGGVYSYAEHHCKPDLAIYEILLSRYKLDVRQTVFLDDSEQNIESAKRLGIHGIIFSSFEQAKQQLEQLLQQS